MTEAGDCYLCRRAQEPGQGIMLLGVPICEGCVSELICMPVGDQRYCYVVRKITALWRRLMLDYSQEVGYSV